MKKIILSIAAFIAAAVLLVSFVVPQVMFDMVSASLHMSSGLEVKKAMIGDHRFIFLEGGKGEAMVLIHGFGADKDNWTPFAKYFTSRYHVIIPDLPGFGENSRIEADSYDVRSQVERVHAFLASRHITKYHLAGQSMGGNIVGIYAATYPDEVITLMMVDNAGVTAPHKSGLTLALDRGENPLLVNNAADFDKLLAFSFVQPPYLPHPVKAILAKNAVKNRPFNDKIWRDFHAKPAPLEPVLASIKAPTLVVWGDQDQVVDISVMDVMKQKLKHGEFVVIKQCGHSPMLEKTREHAAYYQAFLDKNSK